MEIHKKINKDYIHHQKFHFADVLKEIIFGIEDGMVSTLGSITGIAIGSGSHPVVILAGVVIISVESISMGIGSYLSNRSEEEMEERKIKEEREELEQFPEEEKQEIYQIYLKDGWSQNLATQMSEEVSKNKEFMLKEMITRELKISGDQESVSLKAGLYMFFAYILGGIIPLSVYFFLPIKNAIPLSITITLLGLFGLGMTTTKFTKQPLLKSGFRVLLLGGVALIAGLTAGLFIGE